MIDLMERQTAIQGPCAVPVRKIGDTLMSPSPDPEPFVRYFLIEAVQDWVLACSEYARGEG
jgi:hypothetical protein